MPGHPPGVGLLVGKIYGVKVGRGEGVMVGVGDTYQREVIVGVREGGMTGVGVIIASGGYSSSMAGCQSSPPVKTNSLNRAAGDEALQVTNAGKRSQPKD